jgi:crotonobetainyl-CoA:carnitine CoA-transferase CaiB-like acyl-CoA transferase
MATAPDYLTNADRIANRDEMTRRLTEATLRRSKAELLAACEAQGVPAGPINDLAEVFADPQVIARGMRTERPTACRACARPSGFPTPRSRRTGRPRNWARTTI